VTQPQVTQPQAKRDLPTDPPDVHLAQARVALQNGLAWAQDELDASTTAEALLIVGWQVEQATAAARHLAIHALADQGLAAAEIADLPGVWMTAEEVMDEVLLPRPRGEI
jgi:hypothetical protein